MKVSGGIKIDIAAADGFTVSLSKYAHSYGVTADGTLKENLDTGLIKVSVKNGKTQLICPSTTTTQPSINGTYKVTSIVMGSGMTISKSISGNQFVFWPASYTVAGQVTMTLTIVAMWEGEDYTFTQEVAFSKTSDGREGSNYLYMGWWKPSVTYSKTELGIPLVKKADGTTLGYSGYTLKADASTPGSFILSEWDLVETVSFIYMQEAYIERLQAEIITADKINAMDITSRRVLALDAGNNKIASMNEFGDGAYIQYYPSGRKRMEFGGGLIIYYSDDALNSELWTLGQSGSIHSTTLDRWVERYLVATDTNGTNVKKQVLPSGGIMYKEFRAGSGSTYTSYNGLTVMNTVNSSTTPNLVPSGSYIPSGWYTTPVVAMSNQDDPPYTFRRTLVYFSSGKQTTSKEIVFTDYGDGLPTE